MRRSPYSRETCWTRCLWGYARGTSTCPALDPHRQESQRDFGDPIGITSRAYIEGLFGVQPNLIANDIRLRPGFPREWDHASLKHKDFDLSWRREGMADSYEFKSRFGKTVPVTLVLPARTTRLPVVTVNGTPVQAAFDASAVGEPSLIVKMPAAAVVQSKSALERKPAGVASRNRELQPGAGAESAERRDSDAAR